MEVTERELKRLDIKFLRDSGLLFEINRRVLHPLGLALEVFIEDDGTEVIKSLWDCRHDPEGILYAEDLLPLGAGKITRYMSEQGIEALNKRFNTLGYVIQNTGGMDYETRISTGTRQGDEQEGGADNE